MTAAVPPLPFGAARVVEPADALPQAARVLDVDGPLRDDEVAIAVSDLNLDAASFHQIRTAAGGDVERMRTEVRAIIGSRGKMHNPVTGSGGMLIGRVADAGAASGFAVGERVATLVSLTATPLALDDDLGRWDGRSEIIPTRGRAVVFGDGVLVRLPDDLAEETALSIFDVAGAPALTLRTLQRPLLVGHAERLLVLGGGKSAVLSAAAARRVGVWVQAVVPFADEAEDLRGRDLFDEVIVADARHPLALRAELLARGPLADVTLVCVNQPGCEHAPLLATRPGGAVVYFSMATEFAAVALGAEALTLDLDLFIGSGYVPGHAELAVELARQYPAVLEFFDSRSAAPARSTGTP
ncbi:L-erythro-3,5-diaminohexanoate dehydrogenase [Nocardioides sp. L-11A]|uniref:L-erythro-3,5-diaminohexanoate dehydrogenase n=1 Tax=Nocardioides sp. L-11A TaxID=3043848 RepID=UPI002499CCCA|nr:L-erythro-3,5-diaminohexanoate dehydrogenase [Nocardioides sp. L-11A]